MMMMLIHDDDDDDDDDDTQLMKTHRLNIYLIYLQHWGLASLPVNHKDSSMFQTSGIPTYPELNLSTCH